MGEYVYPKNKGPKTKHIPAPRCNLCGSLFKSPKAHKYDTCWHCRPRKQYKRKSRIKNE